MSVYSARGIDRFRSVDINAPTPESGYTVRPDPAYGRIREMQPEEPSGKAAAWTSPIRGTLNKYFTGFGRYTWSRYESNQEASGGFRKTSTRRTTSGRQSRLGPAQSAGHVCGL